MLLGYPIFLKNFCVLPLSLSYPHTQSQPLKFGSRLWFWNENSLGQDYGFGTKIVWVKTMDLELYSTKSWDRRIRVVVSFEPFVVTRPGWGPVYLFFETDTSNRDMTFLWRDLLRLPRSELLVLRVI